VSRFDDDRWAAIEAGFDLDPDDEPKPTPEPPPRHTRNVLRDLADYPPTT
jgi:hypothetical protein